MDITQLFDENLNAAARAIKLARDGDTTLLVRRLADPEIELQFAERSFLAQLLNGDLKRPAHRPGPQQALTAKHLRSYAVYRRFRRLGDKVEQAQDSAATELHVSARTIRSHIRTFETNAPSSWRIAAEVMEMTDNEASAYEAEINSPD